MFKRLFFASVGLGAGVALGVWAVRKVERAQSKLTPEHAARVTAARAEGFGARLAEAVQTGRIAAAEKEVELREVYRVRHERVAASAPRPTPGPATGDPPAAG